MLSTNANLVTLQNELVSVFGECCPPIVRYFFPHSDTGLWWVPFFIRGYCSGSNRAETRRTTTLGFVLSDQNLLKWESVKDTRS